MASTEATVDEPTMRRPFRGGRRRDIARVRSASTREEDAAGNQRHSVGAIAWASERIAVRVLSARPQRAEGTMSRRAAWIGGFAADTSAIPATSNQMAPLRLVFRNPAPQRADHRADHEDDQHELGGGLAGVVVAPHEQQP